MIESFRHGWLRDFYVNGVHSKTIPASLESRLIDKLFVLESATSEKDLRSPPGNRFEKLSGKLEGFCSICVNKQWRLVFEWEAGRAAVTDLYLDDHSYR